MSKPQTSNTERLNILGMQIDPLTIHEAIARIIKQTSQPGCHYVVKPYVEFFDKNINEIINRSWLSLPDGVALQWAAYYQSTNGSLWQLVKTLCEIVIKPRRIRSVMPDRFAGINFTWPLLEAAAKHGKSVFLVGSPLNNSIGHTAKTLQANIEELKIAGTLPGKDESGEFSKQLEEQLLKELKTTQPDIVLIGIGHPKQELLMNKLCNKLSHGVLIGEGGTFDYQKFGGKRPKAPRVVQMIGLEWFWRLILEPSRWRRQLAIPRFIYKMYRDLHSRRNNV